MFKKGDKVSVQVIPNDNIDRGQGVNSSNLTILNIPPTWVRDILNVTLQEDFTNYTSVYNLSFS